MSKSKAPTPTSAPSPTERSVVTSVVLPTHNEAANIPQLIDEITEVFASPEMAAYRPYEVIFVDDSSDDRTPRLIRELAAEREEIHGLFLRRQWGQSAALAAGFDHAVGEYIVPMDADLQNDPHDMPRLFDELEKGYDCVSGNRANRDDPWHKTIPSAIQTKLAKFTGPDINDFGCTLTVYRADALAEIDLRGETHRYIPAQLYDKGRSVTEIDVNHRPREHGDSRYGMGRLLRGFVDLLFHWFWVRYSTRPIHLLGGGGLLFMAAGGLIGAFSVVQKYAFGVSLAPRTPRLVLTALLLIFGLQLLVFGALAEMLTKIHYRDDHEYRIESAVGYT